MTNLNYYQTQAVTNDAEAILCIAGPGSDKTRVLTERIKRLIGDGVDPSQICAISYTVAASEEIQRRVGSKLGYCGTLHGLCLRMIRRNASDIGYLPNVSIIGEKAEAELLDGCKTRQKYKGSDDALKAVLAHGPGVNVKVKLGNVEQATLVAKDYWQTLRRNNLMTCDGLLHYGAKVCSKSMGFKHLLVDELQDASDLDAKIYMCMNVENRFFVGDPDQSIFGFRGGSPRFILSVAKGGLARVIMLETNYRSEAKICQAATRLIQHNTDRVDKAVVPVVGTHDEPVTFTAFKTPGAEMAWLANNILRLEGKSVAVLCRNNSEVKAITDYLVGLGVPVASRQAAKLPTDFEAGLTFLAFLGDPGNDMLAYWATKHLKGKEVADTVRLGAMAAGKSVNETYLHNTIASPKEAVDALESNRFSAEFIDLANAALENAETIGDLILALRSTSRGAETEGVHVGTIHGAKGREWDSVFLPSFEQEIIPGTRKDVDVSEERRLAFVALTRARFNVSISWCETRVPEFGKQTPQPRRPSQFIEEMKG